jgi:hypothetical protein
MARGTHGRLRVCLGRRDPRSDRRLRAPAARVTAPPLRAEAGDDPLRDVPRRLPLVRRAPRREVRALHHPPVHQPQEQVGRAPARLRAAPREREQRHELGGGPVPEQRGEGGGVLADALLDHGVGLRPGVARLEGFGEVEVGEGVRVGLGGPGPAGTPGRASCAGCQGVRVRASGVGRKQLRRARAPATRADPLGGADAAPAAGCGSGQSYADEPDAALHQQHATRGPRVFLRTVVFEQTCRLRESCGGRVFEWTGCSGAGWLFTVRFIDILPTGACGHIAAPLIKPTVWLLESRIEFVDHSPGNRLSSGSSEFFLPMCQVSLLNDIFLPNFGPISIVSLAMSGRVCTVHDLPRQAKERDRLHFRSCLVGIRTRY